jgi:hypothetical protein
MLHVEMERAMSVRFAIVTILFVSAAVRPGVAEAQVKPAVTVVLFQNARGASVAEEDRARLSDALGIALVDSDRVRVLDRTDLPQATGSGTRLEALCAQAVAANVDYVAVGTIERSRAMFLMTVELFDARASAPITRIPVQEPVPPKPRRAPRLPRVGRGPSGPVRTVLAIAAARASYARAMQPSLNLDRVAARLSAGIVTAIQQRSTSWD